MHPQATVTGPARAALVGLVLSGLALTACGPQASAPRSGSTASAPAQGQGDHDSPAPVDTPSATLCSGAGPAGGDDVLAYCRRVTDDKLRRSNLTSGQRAEAETTADAVDAAIGQVTLECAEPVSQECLAEEARRRMFPATGSPEQTADRVRQALTAAGFTDIVVRPAGPADPAPRSAIVYAVRAGAGCVVGHLDGGGRSAGQPQAVGALPHGRCLA
ncbi:hypothetical protein [Micromonospora sp. NBRC 107095]|uniref:hypothetical protein n=1 Tax=Micromonospora sp. NBRC 107095 TaxID=3032209 RepID=UPI002556A478|nr:hypothetical protein [Micromonospora sp. NBRC 107095]